MTPSAAVYSFAADAISAPRPAGRSRAQALAEILERQVKFAVIAGGLCLPAVPSEVIDRYPGITSDYACRILFPGMAEIYPGGDLKWKNNTLGNIVRPAILQQSELDNDTCDELHAAPNKQNIADERPVATLIGLAPNAGSLWADLHVGELKSLLALAAGRWPLAIPTQATKAASGCTSPPIDGCRRLVYRCIDDLLELPDPDASEAALVGLYGDDTLDLATDLINGEIRFFGLASRGLQLAGCELHGRLLAEYAKTQHAVNVAG